MAKGNQSRRAMVLVGMAGVLSFLLVPGSTPAQAKAPGKNATASSGSHHVAATRVAATSAIVNNSGCTTTQMQPNDDGSSPDGVSTPASVSLGFTHPINFYGIPWSDLYVNNNGNVSFGNPESVYTPSDLTTANHFPTLAPFFADVDTRGTATQTAPASGVVSYGPTTFNGHAAFCVDWPNVGYYDAHTDKLNTFQLIIVDRPDLGTSPNGDDFEFYFNYGQIQWEAGDASGGSGGLCSGTTSGCVPAYVGYTNGSGNAGTNFELPGSGQAGAFLDSNTTTGLVNGTTQGSLHFSVHAGVVSTLALTPHDFPASGGSPLTSLTVSGATASFTTSSTDPASAYTATIDWGDDTNLDTATTVSGTPANGFDIIGQHTYAHDGVYTVTTTVSSTSVAAQSITSTVTVLPIITGVDFIGPSTNTAHMTATFVDPDASTTAASYGANIDWGDGQNGAAVVSPDANLSGHAFNISGDHAFTLTSLHVFTVTTSLSDAFHNSVQTTSNASISPCDTSWIGPANSDWSIPGNWSNGESTPTGTQAACIASGTGLRVTVTDPNNLQFGSLTLINTSLTGGNGPVLDVSNNGQACGAASALLRTSSGVLISSGSQLTVSDSGCGLRIGGTLENQGSLSVQQGSYVSAASLKNDNGGDVTVCGGQLPNSITNKGQVTVATTCGTITTGLPAHNAGFAQVQTGAATTSTSTGNVTNLNRIVVEAGSALHVAGNYLQGAGGFLSLALGSPNAAMTIGQQGTFNGTFDLIGSTLPDHTIVPLITYGSEQGAFSTAHGPLGGAPVYGPTTMSFVVGHLNPVLTLSGPTGINPAGQPATLHAALLIPSSLPSTLPAPAGFVQFLVDGHMVSRQALAGGTATAAPTLTPGQHTITAGYEGNSLWSPLSVSGTVVQAAPGTAVTQAHNTTSGGSGSGFFSTGLLSTSTTPTSQVESVTNNVFSGFPPDDPLVNPQVLKGPGPSTPGGGGGGGGGQQHSETSTPIPLPSIVSVLSPFQISTSIKLIAINLLIALLLVLLLALPAELLNAAVRENYADVTRLMRITGGRLHGLHRVASELPSHFALIFFMVLGAVLYTLLDPAFGFNITTAAELAGLLGAFLCITATHDLARSVYFRRRRKQRSRLTTFPAGIIFAVALVLVSRVFHFQPGFIFGLMTGLAFSQELPKRDDGKGLAIASIIVLLVSVVAWFLWVPVKQNVDAAQSNPAFIMLVLDTLLATVWVAGIQSIIFAFIPLRFMDGEKVIAWSKFGWLGIYVLSMFIFVHTVLHPTSTRFGNSDTTSITSLAILLISFTALAVVVWTFFFVRNRLHPHEVVLQGAGGVELLAAPAAGLEVPPPPPPPVD